MADALEYLDGVEYYHREMLLLHTQAAKRGTYKKVKKGSNGDE